MHSHSRKLGLTRFKSRVVLVVFDGRLSLYQLSYGALRRRRDSNPQPTVPDNHRTPARAELWAETLALMKEYQSLQTDMPASAFWTDAFLPK